MSEEPTLEAQQDEPTFDEWQREIDELFRKQVHGKATIPDMERLIELMDYRIDQIQQGNFTPLKPLSSTGLPPRFNELIGEVIICASRAENEAGVYLQTSSGEIDKAVDGFGATSTRLLKKLKGKIPDPLWKKFNEAMDFRHYLVHGVLVEQKYFFNNEKLPDELTEGFVAMKRSYGQPVAGYHLHHVNEHSLTHLRDDFLEIEEGISAIHGEMLRNYASRGFKDLKTE